MSPPPALSPQRFGRVAQCYGVPAVHRGRWQARRTSTVRAYPLAMLRGSRSLGHFLWVTFLLGQQKKSDSSVGRRSKRPLRKRHSGDNARCVSGTLAISLKPKTDEIGWPASLLKSASCLAPFGVRRNDD